MAKAPAKTPRKPASPSPLSTASVSSAASIIRAPKVRMTSAPKCFGPLTPQQSDFVDFYFAYNFNGTRAAIKAGYSRTSAHVQASELLRNPKVRAALDARMAEHRSSARKSADDILRELELVGFANMIDYLDIDPVTGRARIDLAALTPEQAAAIQEYTVDERTETDHETGNEAVITRTRFKLLPKIPALELLARHHGLLKDGAGNDPGGINLRFDLHIHSAREKLDGKLLDGK